MMDLLQLEQQKEDLLAPFQSWSSARLAHRPTPGAWSTAEVFNHLMKTEAAILRAAQQGVLRPQRIGLRDRLGYIFIEKLLRSDRKVKVPDSAPQVLPDRDPELQAVSVEWQTVREDLRRFYEQLSPEQLREGIFRHPVSGWMNMPRILGFFWVHMVHHSFQLARLSTASEDL